MYYYLQVIRTISQPQRYRIISLRPSPQLESDSIPPQVSRRLSQSSGSNSPSIVTKPPSTVRNLPETIPPQVSRRLSQSSVSKSSSPVEKSPSTNSKSTSTVSKLPPDSFSLFKLPLRLISHVLSPLIPPTIRQNTTSIISPLISFQMPLTFTTNHHSNPLPCNTNIHYSTNNSPVPCNPQSGVTNNIPFPFNPIPGITNNCFTTCITQNSSTSLNHLPGIINNTSSVSDNHHDTISETSINLPFPCHPKPGNNFYNLLCNCFKLLSKIHNFSCISDAVEDSSTTSPTDSISFWNETDNTSTPAPNNTTPPIDVQPTADNITTDETRTNNTIIDGLSISSVSKINDDLSSTSTSNDCNSTASDSSTITSTKPIHPCLLKHKHKINKPCLQLIHTQKQTHFTPHSSSIYRIPVLHDYSQVPSKFHPPNHASCSSPLAYFHSLFKPTTYKPNDISLYSKDELVLKMLQSLISSSDLSLGSSTSR